MTDRQEELIALHALRVLTPEEVRLAESESRYDTRMREAQAEFEAAAAEIAYLLPEEAPPEEVRSQLLAQLKVHARGKAVPFSSRFRLLRSPLLAWSVAASLAVAVVIHLDRQGSMYRTIMSHKRGEEEAREKMGALQASQKDAEKKLAEAASREASLRAEMEKLRQDFAVSHTEVAMLRSTLKRFEETTSLVIWSHEQQEGLLKLENMPAVPANKDYQLWVVCKKCKHPVSAGIVKVNPNGEVRLTFKPAKHIEEAVKFAISVEALGGVPEKSDDGQVVFASR